MELFDAFRYLHVLAMFAAVAASVAPETIVYRLARSGDVAALRAIGDALRPFGLLAPVLFLIGVAFGLLAAAAGSLDFFRPWLIAAYLVFAAVVFVVAGPVGSRWQEAVFQAVQGPAVTAESAAFRKARSDVRGAIAVWTSYLGIAVLVFLMVVKPS